MSKNTKHKLYKEYLTLLEKSNDIQMSIENLGYIELDEPIHHGYDASFILRDDIARSNDGSVYQRIIDKYGLSVWCRDTKFEKKEKRKGSKILKLLPYFKSITEKEYIKLSRKDKEFFSRHTLSNNQRIMYKVSLPKHYLKIKVKKSYITHRAIIDWELESEYQFVRDKLWDILNVFNPYNSNIKGWTKIKNKSDRRNNKIALQNNLIYWSEFNGVEDESKFTYKTRHGVRWMRY